MLALSAVTGGEDEQKAISSLVVVATRGEAMGGSETEEVSELVGLMIAVGEAVELKVVVVVVVGVTIIILLVES